MFIQPDESGLDSGFHDHLAKVANRALAHSLKLANEVKARVTIVTVTAPWSALDLAHEARLRKPDPIHQFEEMAAASAKVILDAAAPTAKMAGVVYELVHVPEQHPAEGIIATAEKKGCDLIVMASHGCRALGRLLLGSQVNEVLAHSKIPVLIVR